MGNETELVQCAQCKAMVRKGRMPKHMAKLHSLEALLARSKRAVHEQQLVECPHCKKKIQRKSLPEHIRTAHAAEHIVKNAVVKVTRSTNTQSSMRQQKSRRPKIEEAPENRFTTEREKNAFWREIEAPELEDDAVDVFDKRRVVHGGGYGLGKNRRH